MYVPAPQLARHDLQLGKRPTVSWYCPLEHGAHTVFELSVHAADMNDP